MGCSNETLASSSASVDSTDTVVAEDSCASSSHDCCAKKEAHHVGTTANNVTKETGETGETGETDSTTVRPMHSSMMESCPLAVSASAIVSKVRAETSKAAITKTVEAPLSSTTLLSNWRGVDQASLYNRGPTYLRCCVFLI